MERKGEKQFLEGYVFDAYDRPSVATDIVIFSLQTEDISDYRNDPVHKISVLLIKRGEHPFMDMWALPGGFLRKGENLEECAFRELREETGFEPESMMWVSTRSNPGRDPRGWIISHSCVGLFTENEASLISGTDAREAAWFQAELKNTDKDNYTLTLVRDDIRMDISLRAEKTRMGMKTFLVQGESPLAFDHGAIIAEALEYLRHEAEDISIVFRFLPEKFTLSMLQRVHETIMGVSHLTPNFRRKISGLVEETDEYTEGAGHRPARLYKARKN